MQGIRNNLATIVTGIVVVALIVAAFLLSPWQASDQAASVVVIHDGEGEEQRLPLSRDARVVVVTSLGSNTVVIENGEARVVDADCPGGDCMRQQPIARPGQQLICLPHKFWVEVQAPDDTKEETTMDTGAVRWQDENDVDLVAR